MVHYCATLRHGRPHCLRVQLQSTCTCWERSQTCLGWTPSWKIWRPLAKRWWLHYINLAWSLQVSLASTADVVGWLLEPQLLAVMLCTCIQTFLWAIQYHSRQLKCITTWAYLLGEVALVERYKLQECKPSQMCSTWLVCSPRNLGLISLEEIICAVTYSSAKGKVTCLTPAFLYLWRKMCIGSCKWPHTLQSVGRDISCFVWFCILMNSLQGLVSLSVEAYKGFCVIQKMTITLEILTGLQRHTIAVIIPFWKNFLVFHI